MGARSRRRGKNVSILKGGFVQIPWKLLNSKAYKELKHSAGRALPYFLGKPKVPYGDPQKYSTRFHLSYTEAKKYGFATTTHHNVISELMEKGFIDPVAKGGLRGSGRSLSYFKLSERWETFGTKDFEEIESWKEFYQGKK